MAMTPYERVQKYRATHKDTAKEKRKASDKRYRQKHREELYQKQSEWRKANPEAVAKYHARDKERYYAKYEKAVSELTEHYFYSWVSPIGADRLFSGDEIWANKDAIRGWLYNEDNWSEEDRANFSKIRKKDMPRLVDGISERVIQQIATNNSALSIEW